MSGRQGKNLERGRVAIGCVIALFIAICGWTVAIYLFLLHGG